MNPAQTPTPDSGPRSPKGDAHSQGPQSAPEKDSPKAQRKKKRGELSDPAPGAPNLGDASLPFWITLAAFVMALAPLLTGVPSTESAGPGWAHLLLLPAGIAACFAAQPTRFMDRHWVLWILALLAFVSTFPRYATFDNFEARRVAIVFSTSAIAYLAGTTLNQRGRERVTVSLAWLPWALLAAVLWNWSGKDMSWREALATPAGNRSDLAEFAWPGLVCGLAVFLSARRKTSALWGGLGALMVAVLFGAGPIYAGAVALFATALAVLIFGWRHVQASRLGRVLLITAAVAALAVVGRSTLTSAFQPHGAPTTDQLAADREQGLAVRWELWRTTWAMAVDSFGSGVGPGQFQASYPRYRSDKERELSSHQGQIQNPIEVEHAHHDGLHVLSEWGYFWGSWWIFICLAIGWSAIRTLRGQDYSRLAPAAIWLGILAWGLWNAPLAAPVFSHALAWVFAGMLTQPDLTPTHEGAMKLRLYRRLSGRGILPGLALLTALVQVPRATDFIRHGFALTGASLDPADRAGERAIREALAIQPDSTLALDLWAHYGSGLKESQLKAFERLSELRFDHRGVWNDWGTRLARLARFDEAGVKFERALEIDPDFGPALRNRISVYEDQGASIQLAVALTEASERGATNPDQFLPRAHFLLTQGLPDLAAVYGRLHNPELDLSDPDQCYAQGQAAKIAGETEAERAYLVGAQQGFAREHATREDWKAAVRNYRQALRIARGASSLGKAPLALRIEMAAALDLNGEREAARAELHGLTWSGLSPRLRNHAPEWAKAALPDFMAP